MNKNIEIKLVDEGAIVVNSANFLHLSDDAFLLSSDCDQKRPCSYTTSRINHDTNNLTIFVYIGVDESDDDDPIALTLYVDENAKRTPSGKFASTCFEINGLPGSKWYIVHEDGKWGPRVYGVRRSDNCEDYKTWPSYSKD